MKFWTRVDWLIVAVFGVLVALFYWRILTPNLADRQSFPPGDFHAQFWAFATLEVQALSQGHLPLWNPYTFAGAPFWADVQSAVFYPPSLLTILLSAPWGFSLFALEIEAIAHFWLAALFMYLFVREITQSRAAAVIAALTFTFSGYLTGYPSQQLAVLEADVWLPLILFFLYRDYKQRMKGEGGRMKMVWLIPAGIAWGFTVLAGHPQSAFIVACISSAYFIFLWLTAHPLPRIAHHKLRITHYLLRLTRYALRLVTHYALFILTGLALAAIQFIPATEYTLLSVRAEGTYDKMSGGFPLTDVVQLLLPGQVSVYSPLYVGIVGLILAVWVIFAAPNRHIIFWGVVAAITLLISFGGHTFLYSPLYLTTPGFSIFRGQERWAFATAFSLAVLDSYGFKQLTNPPSPIPHPPSPIPHPPSHIPHPPSQTSSLQTFTKYLFFFALLLDFLFFFGLNDTGWTANSPFYTLFGASTLLTILLALAWLLWVFSPRLPPVVFTLFTAALICLDLFTANWQTNLYPQLPEWHTQTPAIVEAIKADAAQTPDEPYRVYNEFRIYDNYGIPYEIEDLWGASPLRPDRYDKLLAPPMPIERVWELLNVKYVITWRQELFVPSTIIYQEPAGDGTTYLHKLDTVGPRAWLVTQIEIADDDAILQRIADPNFARRQIALLEPEAAPYLNHLSEGTHSDFSNEESNPSSFILHPSSFPERLTAQITTPVPVLLIFSEPHYPGWQATVNGQPAPLLRAYYNLRAVPVPAGDHTVSLTFRPLSFTLGAIISALTVIGVTVALALSLRRRGSM